MITHLKQLFTTNNSEDEAASDKNIKLACAALMVEVMVIDRISIRAEQQQIIRMLHNRFGIDIEDAEELFAMAKNEVRDATSLYQFTKIINSKFHDQQKFELIQQLWQVAYADEDLDKHEEAIIRRIAELIYLPHSQFIRAKRLARDK
ncbi:MAG: TerB family tellurite resistance protein [Pseudomonadales bacterium]|nr:TerB family tellurite resistance protein [Pseudomonadales bacterium]MCP5171690.1 TerB family tellurite resistance protein [Pseudomonadales bacterium]